MKRMLAILLSAIFILTSAVPSVLAQEANGKGIEKTVSEGESVALKEVDGESVFTFVPTATAFYRFYSYDLELGDPMVALYSDEEIGEIVTNDDSFYIPYGERDYNFDLRFQLKKGVTYQFHVRDYSSSYLQCKVKVEQLNQITVTLQTDQGFFENGQKTLSYTTMADAFAWDLAQPYEGEQEFLGWSINTASRKNLIAPDTVLENGKKYCAVWGEATKYTFHGTGGAFSYYVSDDEEEDLDEEGTLVTEPDHTIEVAWNWPLSADAVIIPERDGYEFTGWRTAEGDANHPVDLDNYPMNGPTDLYAIWTPVLDEDEAATELKVGEAANADWKNNRFVFVPEKTGYYLFYSTNQPERVDIIGTLYSDTVKQVAGGDRGFRFVKKLTAGKAYYLITVPDSHLPAEYQVMVKPAVKVKLNSANGYFFTEVDIDDEMEPEDFPNNMEMTAWAADGEDLYATEFVRFADNREVFLGWSKTKGSKTADVTPETKIKKGDTLYAVSRNWKSKNISKGVITGLKTQTYTGKAIEPKVVVWYGKDELVKDVDYKVTFKKNKGAGIAKMTIKGKGDYTGTLKATFKIKPPKTKIKRAKNVSKSTVSLEWKKAKSGTGYQIQYGQKKTMKGAKKVTIKKLSTTQKTIKKLKKGKTYYFRIRVYKKTSSGNLYSKWSSIKKVKIKK